MTNVTKKFSKEELKDLLYGDAEDLKVIKDEIIDQRRWVTVNELIFQEISTEKFYQTCYEYGSTECQDQSPFEYDDNEIDCTEVEPVEVTVIDYKVVKQ